MKWLLVSCLVFLIALQIFGVRKSKATTKAKEAVLIADSINFAKQVQPIFIKNCSPCHFPGGKMYARMPFDHDTTIVNHETGILRRIKDNEETLMITNFIAQNKNGLSSDRPLH